ncbi:Type IIS restriction enzyme Eco57I [anaerobic digester metagenome]
MIDAPEEIIELVEQFQRNIKAYKNVSYKEEQLKQEFINPFFKALGWDVDNTSRAAPQYKDVIFEDSIKVAGGTKAPDYCFTLAGRKMFFVETKKPSVNIDQDIAASYQLRRYAWSAKLPLSILTDFEELAVYDSRVRPKKTDRASAGRIKILKFTEYVDEWNYLYNNFSKDAVLKGSFDQYAESTKKKKGTTEVDQAFLSEIENWRELFAKNIALRNPELTVDELNFTVQQTIDRIIFIRMCEDRGIEKYGQLRSLINEKDIYQKFGELCLEADAKYNSGLFHFKEEKGRPSTPDELTLGLNIDDGVFKTILKSLYYPESPYEFSVLQPEILGNVYEQFLGKVIRLTSGHRAKVEEKPEVKKAGGVYYTPQYIVDYIVENTVGKLCQGKTPNKVSKLRILDPACGSGSFLLGAYKYLLQWHRDYYSNQKDKKRLKDKIYEGKNGELFLTIQEKKRILLNNIYGVDIDSQAVWVTKLSLLLKVLEGENKDALEAQQKLFKERALPDLDSNIKCGNSLIGSEIYSDMDLELTGEEIRLINPFDWNHEFKDIMLDGRFDVIIGNPPYVDVKILGNDVKQILSDNYLSASRRFDLYVPFVEKGLKLLSDKGFLSYIMPSMFTRRDYGIDLRKTINDLGSIEHVVDFGTNQVFKKATNYVAIYFMGKSRQKKEIPVVRYDNNELNSLKLAKSLKDNNVSGVKRFQATYKIFDTEENWYLLNDIELSIFERLLGSFPPLKEMLLYGSEGIHSGKDQVFFLKTELAIKLDLESPPTYPLAKGKDIHRYQFVNEFKHQVIYPYDLINGTVLSEKIMKSDFPNTWKYLVNSRQLLKGRKYFDKSGKKWYELWCPRDPILYTSQKLVGPEIAKKGEFTLSKDYLFINNKLKALILRENTPEKIEYLLGLLNSSLLTFIHRIVAPPKNRGYFEVKTGIMNKLPIRRIDFKKTSDVIYHEQMVKLVEQMLKLHKDNETTRTPQDRELIKRQIDATDKQIDALVYELYGLTDEEIKIVEDNINPKGV